MSDPKGEWNEHKIELCLWTHVVGQRYAPEMFNNRTLTKRKRTTTNDESQETPKKKKVKEKVLKHSKAT